MSELVGLLYVDESLVTVLKSLLPGHHVHVTTAAELGALAARASKTTIAFVDASLLLQIDGGALGVPVIAVITDAPGAILQRTISLLDSFPWLSHVISGAMLSSALAPVHVRGLLERGARYGQGRVLSDECKGRVALIGSASRRDARFDRMNEFFTASGVGKRAIEALNEVAEELVLNALYDAPVEAGFFPGAVPRTEDVTLPPDRACEISYGVASNKAFVRVRDPFGALTRSRLLSVLRRCSGGNVSIDESRGGAGLGMWRVLSSATSLEIVVIPGQVTDITLTVAIRGARNLLSLDVYFEDSRGLDGLADSVQPDLVDESVTLVR